MKPRASLLLGVALLGLGLGVGYFLGRQSAAARTADAKSNAHLSPGQNLGDRRGKVQPSPALVSYRVTAADVEEKLRALSRKPFKARYDSLRDLARSVDLKETQSILEIAKKTLDRSSFFSFRSALIQRWAESDHAAVLAYAKSLKVRADRHSVLSAAMGAWAAKDPAGALAYAEKLAPHENRPDIMASVLQSVAQTNPQLAMEYLNKAPIYQRKYITQAIITGLAESDPKRAAEMALQNYGADRYGGGPGDLHSVLQKWMRADPDAAIAWFAALPENVRRRTSIIRSFQYIRWDQPELAVRLLDHIPASQAKDNLLQNNLTIWAEQDLDGMRAWLAGRTNPREIVMGQLAAAQSLVHADPAGAVALVQGLKVTERESHAFSSIFSGYAQLDPQAALTAAQSITDPMGRRRALQGVIQGWAENDPAAAAAYALTLPGGPAQTEALGCAVNAWVTQDPKAALEWLKTVPNPASRSDAIRRALWQLTYYYSPNIAAEYLTLLPPGQHQLSAIGEVAESWARERFDEALAWVQSLPNSQARHAAYQRIAVWWAEYDLEGAAAFAKDLPSGQLRSQMLMNIASEWAWRDPKEAMEYAKNLPADPSRQSFMQAILGQWAGRDPQEAAQFIADLPEDQGRNELWRTIASRWASSDPATAIQWVNQLPAGDGRVIALSGALSAWATFAPQEAAQYAIGLSGGELERGVKAVMGGLVQADPVYSAQWIQNFPEGRLREEACETLMKSWPLQDPSGAAKWLGSQPAGPSREKAVEHFVNSVAVCEPSLAWQWALTLHNPEKQQEALQTTVRQWMRINSAQARQTIQQSGLPPPLVQRLLETTP